MAHLSEATIKEAVEWHLKLKEAPSADCVQEAHQHWLQSHCDNQKAWSRLERFTALTERDDLVTSATLMNARNHRRDALKLLSCILLAGGAYSGYRQFGVVKGERLATSIGEYLKHTLPDGSIVELNTATELRVQYTPTHRALSLSEGEVLITTATDPLARPFIVTTPVGTVQALGTEFIVFSDDKKLRVNVMAHAVKVTPTAQPNSVIAQAGEQVILQPHRLPVRAKNPTHIDSWRTGVLVVKGWTLEQLINELKRYHTGKISLSHDIAHLKISGTFQLNDTHFVLKNISQTLNIQLHYLTQYWARLSDS